jgi:uncharacterized protein
VYGVADMQKETERVVKAIKCLTIYRNIFDDPVLQAFRELFDFVVKKDSSVVNKYYDLIGMLLELKREDSFAELNLFKNHLLDIILSIENVFSLASEQFEFKEIDDLVIRTADNDLRLLQHVYDFDLIALGDFLTGSYGLSEFTPHLGELSVGWAQSTGYPAFYFQEKSRVKRSLAASNKWSDNIRELHDYYRNTGSGAFGRYWAFKWNGKSGRAGLSGVANPDPIRLDDLVGYETQKQEILRNTGQFVKGFSANNMLLYGDRGTGKSSTIKGLIHIFGAEGLRIIEVSRHDLLFLHHIVAAVEERAQKFIIFIDDLSFEEDETEYKGLKALLEGSISKPPVNVLVYATSNRRNLVREYFSDRDSDEVGRQDTYEEKLSLADRFGIKLVYSAQNKQEYLSAVEDMAAKNGIRMEKDELHELALRWVLWHNARSGRTARQFIDDLKGRLDICR